MKISVIIPHLNQPAALALCLGTLHDQLGIDCELEIIVVDNGSAAMPTAICARWPDVTLIAEPTPGPGPARNAGIARASGDILAFIDADCRANHGWIAAIIAAFADPAVKVIGGDVQVPYADPSAPTMLEAYERIYAYRNRQYVASGYSGTGNLAMRPEAFAATGPFGGIEIAEDRDWGLRARARGFVTRYVAEMIIYHPARKTIAEMQRKWDRHIAHDFSRVTTRGRRLRWLVRALAIGASPLAEIIRIARSDRVRGLNERALALACLTRIRLYRARRMLGLLVAGDSRAMAGSWNRE